MTSPLRPPATQINVWATVTAVSPLDVQLDGEPGALGIDLDAFTLVGGLQVGDRVWVQLTTNTDPVFAGRHAVIIGKAGGVAADPLAPYPVGAVYVSTDSTDPGTLFGGTWSQVTDVFLLAAGSTYTAGDTGGEAEHTLTTAEMPSHKHAIATNNSADAATIGGWALSPPTMHFGTDRSGSTTYRDQDQQSAGGDGAHNNMPPYLVVYVWERTA